MTDIRNRTARHSIFIIREGLKELRYHASRMRDDETSIDRVIKEADLLSQTCKKLLNYVDVPSDKKTAKVKTNGPAVDINRLLTNMAAITGEQHDA